MILYVYLMSKQVVLPTRGRISPLYSCGVFHVCFDLLIWFKIWPGLAIEQTKYMLMAPSSLRHHNKIEKVIVKDQAKYMLMAPSSL